MKQKNNIFEELSKMKNLIKAKPGTVISEQEIQEIGFGMAGAAATGAQKTPSGYNLSGTKNISCVTFPNGQDSVDIKTKTGYSLRLFNNNRVMNNKGGDMGNWSCGSNKCEIKFNFDKDQDASHNISINYTETMLNCGGGGSRGGDYSRIVGDYSKKIQTELGGSPTGQLSDNDLEKALSKLNDEVSGEVSQSNQLPTLPDGQPDLEKIFASL